MPFTQIAKSIISVDTRFSGFGSLFSGIFVIALIHLLILFGIFIKNLYYLNKNLAGNRNSVLLKISWCILSLATFATIFITPVGWYARLSPQVWLAVGLIEISILILATSNLLRISAIIVAALMVINTFLTGYKLFKLQTKVSNKIFSDITQVATEHKPIKIVTNSINHFTLHNQRKIADLFGNKIVIQEQCTKVITGNPIFEICAK